MISAASDVEMFGHVWRLFQAETQTETQMDRIERVAKARGWSVWLRGHVHGTSIPGAVFVKNPRTLQGEPCVCQECRRL